MYPNCTPYTVPEYTNASKMSNKQLLHLNQRNAGIGKHCMAILGFNTTRKQETKYKEILTFFFNVFLNLLFRTFFKGGVTATKHKDINTEL